MIIGTPKELKNNEFRVGLTPDNVSVFTAKGHTVLIETGAGNGAAFTDEEYAAAGAEIVSTGAEVYERADMIIKVKEPEECEYELLREGQILYTYLHLAPNRPLTETLMKRGVKAVAYETITDNDGNLPCLRPMSQIAGRLSIQEGAKYLEKSALVSWVSYPGLESDPQYEMAKKYMPDGTCGVISFGVKGGREAATKFMDSLRLASIVTHVADSKTCVLHPASTTHRQLTDKQLEEAGVRSDLIRLSVGIEDAEDIIADIEQALIAATK